MILDPKKNLLTIFPPGYIIKKVNLTGMVKNHNEGSFLTLLS